MLILRKVRGISPKIIIKQICIDTGRRSRNFDATDLKPQELVLRYRNVKILLSNKQVVKSGDDPDPPIPIPLHLHLSPTTATQMVAKFPTDTKRGLLYIMKGEKQIPNSVIHKNPSC